MRALITNDDGIDSEGLHVLARAAIDAGLDVVVAAPSEQYSGASASITAVRHEGRTVVERRELPGVDAPAWAVRATPGHIVLAGLTGWFDPVPDLVLSGINHGANVGRVVLHSGTVGAALTAGVHGSRGLAVSLGVPLHPTDDLRHWDAAASYLPRVLELLADAPEGTVLSLNAPDLPLEQHKELRDAPLASVGSVQTQVQEVSDGGLRVGEVEVGGTPEEGSDGALLAAGHPTITALTGIGEDHESPVPDWLARRERTSA